jgi:hypothetical protein
MPGPLAMMGLQSASAALGAAQSYLANRAGKRQQQRMDEAGGTEQADLVV